MRRRRPLYVRDAGHGDEAASAGGSALLLDVGLVGDSECFEA